MLPFRLREGSGEGLAPIVGLATMSLPPLTPPASGRGI